MMKQMTGRFIQCDSCGYRAIVWYDNDKCHHCKDGKLETIMIEEKKAKKIKEHKESKQ